MRVPRNGRDLDGRSDDALFELFGAIAIGDSREVTRRLDEEPGLATRTLRTGATREDPHSYFLSSIRHYVYVGDTALHLAAAALQPELSPFCRFQGRRRSGSQQEGAEPLHYAADGSPGVDNRARGAQREVITFLVEKGADPNALDKSGVAALHRAVRNRSSDAVAALIASGADPRLRNKSGSTPLHLAVQNTGKSHSGSDAAKDEQRRIIALLLEQGANPGDVDANGKTVMAAVSSDWIRAQLSNF